MYSCSHVAGATRPACWAQIPLSTLLYISPGTIPRLPRDPIGLELRGESAVLGRQKLQPESVMADVCLGITVAGLYTLVGMGLIIVFM